MVKVQTRTEAARAEGRGLFSFLKEMNMLKIEIVYKVRVIYKSGETHIFEVTKFSYDPQAQAYNWVSANPKLRPIQFGANEIAAVWQVGARRRLAWKKGTE